MHRTDPTRPRRGGARCRNGLVAVLVVRVELEVNALHLLGWSESLQVVWDGTEEHQERIPARVAAIERGAAWVWTERGTTLATYAGLLAERLLGELDGMGLDLSDLSPASLSDHLLDNLHSPVAVEEVMNRFTVRALADYIAAQLGGVSRLAAGA